MTVPYCRPLFHSCHGPATAFSYPAQNGNYFPWPSRTGNYFSMTVQDRRPFSKTGSGLPWPVASHQLPNHRLPSYTTGSASTTRSIHISFRTTDLIPFSLHGRVFNSTWNCYPQLYLSFVFKFLFLILSVLDQEQNKALINDAPNSFKIVETLLSLWVWSKVRIYHSFRLIMIICWQLLCLHFLCAA